MGARDDNIDATVISTSCMNDSASMKVLVTTARCFLIQSLPLFLPHDSMYFRALQVYDVLPFNVPLPSFSRFIEATLRKNLLKQSRLK